MKYSAVIFDLDGVICHTDNYHYLAWKQIADDLSICFDEKINNRLRGVSRMDSLDIILETYNGTLTDQEKRMYAEKKNIIYRSLLEEMSPTDLSDDVRKTLVELQERGYKLAVGSSSKNAKLILNKLGLGDFFDAISDGTNVTRSKPDPEVFICASEYVKVKPEKCIVVEDAKAGIEAAIAANMDSAAIGDATLSGMATHNLKCLSDLLVIL
ncbi:MAG: beta-phosphoglucomutase [Peptostreptococcaceae bacterium]|nr:beta-phosphoglucomutase [Peptostreptococcaceae bacterium]